MNPVYSFAQVLFQFCRQQDIQLALSRPLYRPEDFKGKDLDLFIKNKADIAKIIVWLKSFSDLYITSVFKRHDGVTIHVFGVGETKDKIITIDFIDQLSWKGMAYLNINEVFQRAITINDMVYLDDIDQFIYLIMLHGCKHGGTGLARYQKLLQKTLATHLALIAEKLSRIVGDRKTLLIEDMISSNDYIGFKKTFFGAYFYQSWLRQGIFAVVQFIQHLFLEVRLRLFYPRTLVAVYGVDGAGKSSLIKAFNSQFNGIVPTIITIHFLPFLPWQNKKWADQPQANPHAKAPRPLLLSVLKIGCYLIRYWLSYLWPRRGEVMFIYDRYLPDILIDPLRFRYKGPESLARFLVSLLPAEDIRIHVDIPAKAAYQRKQEISYAEVVRQNAGYKNFLSAHANVLTLDGEKDLKENAGGMAGYIAAYLDKKHDPDIL